MSNLINYQYLLLLLAVGCILVKWVFYWNAGTTRERYPLSFLKWYNKMHIYSYHDKPKRQLFMYASNTCNVFFWGAIIFCASIWLMMVLDAVVSSN
ncbi:MAG: hypothetical protein ACOVNR_11460 [Chitinophagaceae bacterium]